MARPDQRGAKGYHKGKNGSSGLSRTDHEEVSRALVRILRYESSKYSLEGPDGWVSLEDLLQKCKSQIKNTPAEVVAVAMESEGSQGKRFELSNCRKWVRATYKHGSGQSWKGKGRGKGTGSNGTNEGAAATGNGHSNGHSNGYSNGYNNGNRYTGWDNYQPSSTGSYYASNDSYSRKGWQDYGGKDPLQENDPWDQRPKTWGRASQPAQPAQPAEPAEPAPTAPQGAAADATAAAGAGSSASGPNTASGAQSFDISTPRGSNGQEQTWQKFIDPSSERTWLYHAETEAFFFEDNAAQQGWHRYTSDHGPWWHNAETGKWFFDPKVDG